MPIEETERITVRVPVKLVRALRRAADQEERPINTVVARALRAYLEQGDGAPDATGTERKR